MKVETNDTQVVSNHKLIILLYPIHYNSRQNLLWETKIALPDAQNYRFAGMRESGKLW